MYGEKKRIGAKKECVEINATEAVALFVFLCEQTMLLLVLVCVCVSHDAMLSVS